MGRNSAGRSEGGCSPLTTNFITFWVEAVFPLEQHRHAWPLRHEDCFTSVGKGVDAECGLYFIRDVALLTVSDSSVYALKSTFRRYFFSTEM